MGGVDGLQFSCDGPGQQLIDPGDRMIGCTAQHVAQVLLAPELGNQQLEVFDLDRMISQCAVARDDHRLQRGDVIGKRGGICLHAQQCRKRRISLQGKCRTPGAFWLAPVNTFEQHRELCRSQVDLAAVSLRPDEAAALQAFGQ